MRVRTLVVFLVSAALATAAFAQTKISGTMGCAKANPESAIDVGDGPDHVMTLAKVACTWTKSFDMAGSAVKDGYSVTSGEVRSGKSTESGIHVGTMANGDKYFVRFNGTGAVGKDGGSSQGSWAFTGGTGKLKSLKGKGTYKGTGAADGTATVQVDGEYQAP